MISATLTRAQGQPWGFVIGILHLFTYTFTLINNNCKYSFMNKRKSFIGIYNRLPHAESKE